MKRACLLAWVLALPLLMAAGASYGQSAAQTRTLVLDPESKFLKAKKLAGLGDHLRSLAARYPSLKVLRAPDLGLTQLRLKVGCSGSDAKCLTMIGKEVKAQRVLHSQIQRLPGRYLLVMTLVDVAEGRVIEQSRKRSRGGMQPLRSTLLKSWVDVIGPLFRSKLKVRANVAGADVFLDGQNIGQTPLVLTKNMGKGKHVIEVAHPDHEAVRRDIVIEKGRDLEIEVELSKKVETVAVVEAKPVPVPPMPPPPEPPPEAGPLTGTKVPGKPVEKPAEIPVPEAPSGPKVSAVAPKPKPGPQPFLPSLAEPGEGKQDQVSKADPGAESPIYKQWWFWTVVGAVVVAGGTTGLVLGLSGEETATGIPAGKGRVTIEF